VWGRGDEEDHEPWLVRSDMGWIRNIPTEIPFKGWPQGKTGQTGFRNWSDRFPTGNLLKIERYLGP
jgi:hypothetical protein